ncbi:putative metal-dependent hydrolase YcfH [bioreactor metagenome]|uniref:Putative metal-dependent hydrolase YcfH n=1 Tax=bioreactor metagenome TaxID=1076179 RepID=A0A645BSR3_9ZZZZ
MGIYMGIGPQITYPDSECLIELVREMPLELLLLETDAPFLPPSHLIGESAKPDMISFVAEKISSLRGDVTAQEVLDIARENAKLLYNIK